jgi:hypothetical protein
MPAKDRTKYPVGFGKPPRTTRFKKGRSGNPKGRPRGSRTSLTLLEQALSEPVVVTENGQRKKITKGEALMKQVVNKAASGDARAIQNPAQGDAFVRGPSGVVGDRSAS